MAFKKEKIRFLYSILVIFMYLGPNTAINIDCDGKPFHCINSTHFMICVDLGGGVSKTVDDYLIQCPSTTVCRKSNHFECEYQMPTTTASTIRMGDETNEYESSLQATTVSPFPKSNLNTLSVTTLAEFITSTHTEKQSTSKRSFTNKINLLNVVTTKAYEVENLLTNSQKANLSNSNDSHGLLTLPKDEELFQEPIPGISTQSAPVASKLLLDKLSPTDIISTTDIFRNDIINNSDISGVLDKNRSQFVTSSDLLLLDTTTESFSKNFSNNFSERDLTSNIKNNTLEASSSSYLITTTDGRVKINPSFESTTEVKETTHDEILIGTQLSSQDLSIQRTTNSRNKNLTSELYLTESVIKVNEPERNLNTDSRTEISTSINNERAINNTDLLNRNTSLFAPFTDISFVDTTTNLIGKNLSDHDSDYVSNSTTFSTLSYLMTSTDSVIKTNTSFGSYAEAKQPTLDDVVANSQLSSPNISMNKISLESVRQITTNSYYLNTSRIKNLSSELNVTESNKEEIEAAHTLSFDNKAESNIYMSQPLYNEIINNNSEVNNSDFATFTDIQFLDTTTESIMKNVSNDLFHNEFPEHVANSDIVKTTPTVSFLFYLMASTDGMINTNTSVESYTDSTKITTNEIIQISPQDLSINKTSPENVHQIITTNCNYTNTSLIVKNMTSELYVTESNIQVTEAEQNLSNNNKTEVNMSIYNESTITNTDKLNTNNSLFAAFMDITTDSIRKNISNDLSEHIVNSNTVNNTPKISNLSYLMTITDSIIKINTSFESSTERKKTTRDEIILSKHILSEDLSINKTLPDSVNDITTNFNYLNNSSIIKNLTSALYVTESNTHEMEAISSLSTDNIIGHTQKAFLQDIPLKLDFIVNTTPMLAPEYIFNNSRPTSKAIKNSNNSAYETETSTNININDNQGLMSAFEAVTEFPTQTRSSSFESTPTPISLTTNYNYLNHSSIIKNLTAELYVTESNTQEMEVMSSLSTDNDVGHTQRASLQDMLLLKSDFIVNTTSTLAPEYIFNNSRLTSKAIKNSNISVYERESSTNINIINNQGLMSEFEAVTEFPTQVRFSSFESTPTPISLERNSQTTEKLKVLTDTQKVYLKGSSIGNEVNLSISNNLQNSNKLKKKTATNGDSEYDFHSDTELLTTTKSLNIPIDSTTETWKSSSDAVTKNTRLFSHNFQTVSTISEKNPKITENYDFIDTFARTERADLDTSSGTKRLKTISEVKKSELNQVEELETKRTLSSGNKKEINTLLENQNGNRIFVNLTTKPDILNISSVTSVDLITATEPEFESMQNDTFLKQLMENKTALNNYSIYTHMLLKEIKSATEKLPEVSSTLIDSRLHTYDRNVIKTSNNIQDLNIPDKQIAFEIDTPGKSYLLNNVTDTTNSSKVSDELFIPLLVSDNTIIKNKQNEITTEMLTTSNDSLHIDNYYTSKDELATIDTVSIRDYIINTTKQTKIKDETVTVPKTTEDEKGILTTTTAINDATQGQSGGTIPRIEASSADTFGNTYNEKKLSVTEPSLATVQSIYDFVIQSKFSEIIETKPNQFSINKENSTMKVKIQGSGTIDTSNVDVNPSPQNERISNKASSVPEATIQSVTSSQFQTPIKLPFQRFTTEEGFNPLDQNINRVHKDITEKIKYTPQTIVTEFVSENSINSFTTDLYTYNTISEMPTIEDTIKYGKNDEINEDIGIDKSKAITDDIKKTEKIKTQVSLVLEVSEDKLSYKAIEGNARHTTINPITQTLTRPPNWSESITNYTSMRHNTQPNNINSVNINEQQITINLTKVETTETAPAVAELSTNSIASESHLNKTYSYDGQQNMHFDMTKKSIKVENSTHDAPSKVTSSDATISNVFAEVPTTKTTPTLGDIIKLDQYSTEDQNIIRSIKPRELYAFSNTSNYAFKQSSNSFTIGTLNGKKYQQPLSDAVFHSSTISMLHKEKKLSLPIINATKAQFSVIKDVRSTHATKKLFENNEKSLYNTSSEVVNATKSQVSLLLGPTTPIATGVQSLNLSEITPNNNALNNIHDITDIKKGNISKSDLNKSNTMGENLPNVEKSDSTFKSNSSTQLFNVKKDFRRPKLDLKKDKFNLNITVNEMLPNLFSTTTYLESPTKVSTTEPILITQDNIKYRYISDAIKKHVNESKIKGEYLDGWNEKLFVTPKRPAITNNSDLNKTMLKRPIPALPRTAKNKSIDIVGQSYSNRFTCMNRLRGRYADKNDCRKFYICIGKIQYVQGECPIHTVFSEIKKQCTKNLSHCMINNQFHCIQEGRFSDVLNKNIYYICVKYKKSYLRFKFQCQGGYNLNKSIVRCVKDQVSQQQKSSMSIDSESNKASDQSTREHKRTEQKRTETDAEKNICKHEGKFPDPDDCRRYFVCSKNSRSVFRRRTKKCDSDEVFHRERKKCVSDESYECK